MTDQVTMEQLQELQRRKSVAEAKWMAMPRGEAGTAAAVLYDIAYDEFTQAVVAYGDARRKFAAPHPAE